jgi:hypothetical protein
VCVKGKIERHKAHTDQIRQRYALCNIILQTHYIHYSQQDEKFNVGNLLRISQYQKYIHPLQSVRCEE